MSRFVVLSLAAVAVTAAAQPEPPALGIEEALQLAEERSEAVAIARAGLQRAEAERVRARSEWLPQVNGTLSYDRTLASEWDDLFTAPPGGESPFENLPFGRPNTYRVGVSLQQNLYAGGRTSARLSLAAASVRTAELGLASARAQALLDTVQAYYDALLSDRLLLIAESTLKQAQATAEQTQLANERGTKPEFDLLRAMVALENQRPVVLQRRIERQSAQLRLKQLLELPLDQDVAFGSSLEGELVDLGEKVRALVAVPAEGQQERAAVQQATEAVRMREAGVRIAQSQHLPQLNLSMNYGLVNYPETLMPELDQFRDNWTVGVLLQVPIFSGLRVTGDVRSAQADLFEARSRLRQSEELARLDSATTAQQLQTAKVQWEASSGVADQARRAYEIAQIRYREGLSTQLELSDAQLLYEQAQANRARAARDFQVARVRHALLAYLPASPGGITASGMATGAATGTSSFGAMGASTGAPSMGAASSF